MGPRKNTILLNLTEFGLGAIKNGPSYRPVLYKMVLYDGVNGAANLTKH